MDFKQTESCCPSLRPVFVPAAGTSDQAGFETYLQGLQMLFVEWQKEDEEGRGDGSVESQSWASMRFCKVSLGSDKRSKFNKQ